MSSGSCLCSQVKYIFASEPVQQVRCHCNACHKLSGSAYTTLLMVPSPSFNFTSGSSLLKSFSFTHESGMELTTHFCTNCGSCIYKEAVANKGFFIVQAGTLDVGGKTEGGMTLATVKPMAELWVKQRVEWLGEVEGAHQLQEFA